MATLTTFLPGVRLMDGSDMNTNFSILSGGDGSSFTDSIVAHAGGGRASATVLTTRFNRLSTVATGADSVALPAATGGQMIAIANAGANSAQIFAAVGTSDTINAVVAATGIALATNKCIILVSFVGAWHGILSA